MKRSTKSAGVAAMSTALMLTAVGCSGSDASSEGRDELVVMISESTAYVPCLEEYGKKFAEEEGGMPVRVVTEPFATFKDKVQTAFASNSAPWALVGLPYQYIASFEPFLSPVGDQVDDDFMSGINETATSLYTYDGELYAIPFAAQAESLFYRTDLFKKAGMEPPTTWEEFNEAAKFFTDNPDYPGITGVVFKGALPWNSTEFNDRYLGMGGEPLNGEDGTAVDVDLATEALANLQETMDYAQSGSLNTAQPDAAALFASGASAMSVLMPSTVLASITTPGDANKVEGKVGVAPMPGGVGESGGFGLTVPKSSSQPEAAIAFAEFVKSEEADVSCMIDYGNGSVRDASYEDPAVKDLFWSQGFFQTLDAAQPLIGAKSPDGGEIGTAMNETVAAFLAGEIPTAEEAAQRLADGYGS